MDYRDIEWFTLETNRDHSVVFEIVSRYCISPQLAGSLLATPLPPGSPVLWEQPGWECLKVQNLPCSSWSIKGKCCPDSSHPGSPLIPSLLPQLPIGAALTQPSPAPLHQLLPLPTLPPSPGHPPESPRVHSLTPLTFPAPTPCWAQGTVATQSQPCRWVLPDTDK